MVRAALDVLIPGDTVASGGAHRMEESLDLELEALAV
jgi:hypothetical protein